MAEEKVAQEAREALVLHGNGDLTECIVKLKAIQKMLLTVNRWDLDSSVLWSACGIIKGEVDKWGEDLNVNPSVSSLNVVAAALLCLRNSFANCSKTQLLVAETEELLDPVLAATKWTFSAGSPNEHDAAASPDSATSVDPDADKSVEAQGIKGNGSELWKETHLSLAFACAMCLGNMVAANSTSRKLLWPHLLPLLRALLGYDDWRVSQMACMILHNCLLEKELISALIMDQEVESIVGMLLTLYMKESQFSCFVLFCLEALLCSEGIVESSWPVLTSTQRLLSLDVLAAIISGTKKSKSVPSSAITFHVSSYKTEADKLLCTHAGNIGQDDSQVLARLVNFVCTVAASDSWRPLLQQDRSLLITSVYLLRCMNEIGKLGGNANRPSEMRNEDNESGTPHPAFGFKSDIIRLIASLVYRHKDNQDQVREINGLLLLLECTCFDGQNPLIREASIFAIRNLLEFNPENQRVIQELKFEGVADNTGLQELGMEAVVVDGKISVRQLEKSFDESDEPDL